MSYLKPRADGADLRIMSSNILFDKSLENRLSLIADYYLSSDADIIGMQEVNHIGGGIFELISDVYTKVSERHADEKRCFTPIVYRHDRFDLVESGSALYDKRGTDTKSMAWVVLSDKKSGKKVALINSHGSLILASYNLDATDEVEGERWRVDNVRQILEKKDELRAKYGDLLPVFSTGDFNSYPHWESVVTMKKSMPESADVATVSADRNVTTFHPVGRLGREGEIMDFIFVTDDSIEVLVHTVDTAKNALDIADHSPIIADVVLK
jgi:endonuclease/exonuclease/phosphatase family metal-dependent hydrolase